MQAPPTLRTRQLLLQPLTLGDAAAIQERFAHWEVVRYLSAAVPWPYPDDGALSYVRDVALPALARGTEWHWTIRLRSRPDDVIGSISLMDQVDNHRGFWLSPLRAAMYATRARPRPESTRHAHWPVRWNCPRPRGTGRELTNPTSPHAGRRRRPTRARSAPRVRGGTGRRASLKRR